MADSLYVCHFSTGHIKVGRSIDPVGRIATHTDRVACLGVELVEHFIAACAGASEPREAILIARCVAAADKRHQNEWFTGLDYMEVCDWAAQAAAQSIAEQPQEGNRWPRVIAELRGAGLTQVEISRLCNTAQNNISRLSKGETLEPAHSLGERILSLHRACLSPSPNNRERA